MDENRNKFFLSRFVVCTINW